MKSRTETRTRSVPVTHDGITQLVPEQYKVDVVVPSRDVPALVKLVMFRMAVAITVLAVALSVAAIGGLLARLVTPFVAYPAAAVLDGLWIYAVMGEWEARYDPKTARWAQGAGAVFVALSMAAIVVYGVLLGELAAGIIAALIPLGSKGAWLLRFKLTVRKLDPKNQAWLDQTRNDIYARKALAEETRALDAARRITAELNAERAPDTAELERVVAREQPEQIASTGDRAREHPEHARGQIANTASTPPVTSAITDREQPSISELAREQIAITPSNTEAVANILARFPEANAGSVGAAVRRARRKEEGLYL